jgi:hypothetical protein
MCDSSRMPDYDWMPNSNRKTWVQSYARLQSYARRRSKDATLVVCMTLVICLIVVGRWNSNWKTRLWLYAQLWSEDIWLWSYILTLVVHHGSGWRACRLSYQLICERLRMVELDDSSILELKHLVGRRLSRAHDLFSVWNLSISRLRVLKCQAKCYATNEHLAWLDLRETWVSRST